ncbi:hypothetical protein HLK59_49710, partial [Streptomyces sp. S3(2020)]|uniref:bacterial transcriptional activator domain-containing protein n=1 Tax=Streptomyces sp. S3(2020) TaxID=2732044 RepID=UPI00148842C6
PPPTGLALRPGARLAAPRILTISSQPLGLSQVIEDRDGAAHPEDTHPSPSASPTPGNGSGAQGKNSHPSDAATPSATDRPSASGSASGPPGTPSAETPGAASSPASGAATAPASAGGLVNLRTLLGASALLAAALTAVLAWRTRHRRKRGEDNATGIRTAAAGARSAEGGQPDAAARLDTALKTLAHPSTLPHLPSVVPLIRAARIGDRTVRVLPDDLTREPREPFVAGRDGWWALPADAALLDPDTARTVAAPCPALATLGTADDGDLILLNLATLPALLLDGDPVHVGEVCASLTLELAMSPWAHEIDIVTVGFGDDLPDLLPATRITHLPSPAHALRHLSQRLLEAHQLPHTPHPPCVLLCAPVLDTDTATEFAELLATAQPGPLPLTLIAPADTAGPHLPHAQTLDAAPGRPQRLDHLGAGVEFTVQRLGRTAYQQITTALQDPAPGTPPAADDMPKDDGPDGQSPEQEQEHQPHQPGGAASTPATQPSSAPDTDVRSEVFPALLADRRSADPTPGRLPATAVQASTADSPARTVPASAQPPQPRDRGTGHQQAGPPGTPPGPDDGQEADNQAPQIRVLGPIEVDGIDTSGHGPRTTQLAALLYFRPGRTADALCADMDPAHPWSTATLNARLQGLLSRLGNDPAGNPYVPRRNTGDAPYQLSPHVRCAWTQFVHLTQRALPLGPAGLPDLEEALALVRGQPFGGRPMPWAEPHQHEMTTRSIDIAHTVATHRMSEGPDHDRSAARQAVACAIDVDDSAEISYRNWALIEHAAGNRQGVHTAITRIQQINRTLNCPLEPETEHLINTLLHTT